MSLIYAPIYHSEDGQEHYPIGYETINTNCILEGRSTMKTFREVLIAWSGSEWMILSQYEPGAVPALLVENPCNDGYALIATAYNDFRLSQLCCDDDTSIEGGIYVPAYTPQYV